MFLSKQLEFGAGSVRDGTSGIVVIIGINSKETGMRIGVDYYPEHWERSRWEKDLSMMHECGIKVVRIGEFDWSLYEPEEGKYQFEWMDEILDFMQVHDMKVVLGTPSATPPKWMCDKYGERLYQKDIRGRVKPFGTRKHYCFNSDAYRGEVRKLVAMMAERYGHHPAVECWQIDNELGWANTTRCYCEKCQSKFQKYLQKKYGTIDNLNSTYGTVFWSETYNDFSQVIVPYEGACTTADPDGTQGQNPSLMLDFDRFSSDSVISFMNEQIDIIRKYSDRPVTTNMLDAGVNSGTGIDYFKLSKTLDFTAWDNYVNFQWGIAEDACVSRDHALLRGYKHQPFWVMEQQAAAIGWSKLGAAPQPGQLRLWAFSSVANGADTVVFFRWRSCLFGTEEYWNGILSHDGKPNRRFHEFCQVGAEMEKLSHVYGKLVPKSKVAIVKSFDSEWSHKVHQHVEGFSYDNLLLDYYRAFYQLGVAADFVKPDDNLSEYDLVFAPALIMVSEEQKKNLESYVKEGGHLVISFRSGIKSMENTMLPLTAPGVFSKIAGVEVEDYDPQYQKHTSVSGVFGEGTANLWCDVITPGTAEVLGVYTGEYYSGQPCLTENHYGEGDVYYLGCDLEKDAMTRMARFLCRRYQISVPIGAQTGVEIVSTTDEKSDAVFLLNHNGHAVVVPVEGSYTDELTDRKVNRQIIIEAYGVAVLKPDL